MSTRSTSGKSASAAKAKPKASAKSVAKTSTEAKTPKTRLAGPKPPKAKTGAKTAPRSVPAAQVAAARDAKAKAGKTPAPKATGTPTDAAKTDTPPQLKKRELVDLVVARSDVKKKYAKPVVEALLEVLGETVAQGREMNLQPMGKLKYNRAKETGSARIVVARIRQNKAAKPASSPKGPAATAAD